MKSIEQFRIVIIKETADKYGKIKNKFTKQELALLSYSEAPEYLRFNPYILHGYRRPFSKTMCFRSIFWLTNETVNIWSHICSCLLYIGLGINDFYIQNNSAPLFDKLLVGSVLVIFQISMLFSVFYHLFSCCSEKCFNNCLSLDFFGITFSLLGIQLSGVHYMYYCYKELEVFYMSSVLFLFFVAVILQVPKLKVAIYYKQIMFACWAVYGWIPTSHWASMMGSDHSSVHLILPRLINMFTISALAFIIYMIKIPERYFVGKMDYIGSSHQIWHFLIAFAFYYWHNTGMISIEYRLNNSCAL